MRASCFKTSIILLCALRELDGRPALGASLLEFVAQFRIRGQATLRADLHGRHISLIRSFADGPNADAERSSSIFDGLEGFAHTGSCLVYRPELGSDLDRKNGILSICTSIVLECEIIGTGELPNKSRRC